MPAQESFAGIIATITSRSDTFDPHPPGRANFYTSEMNLHEGIQNHLVLRSISLSCIFLPLK